MRIYINMQWSFIPAKHREGPVLPAGRNYRHLRRLSR